jgi:hypothetical protein
MRAIHATLSAFLLSFSWHHKVSEREREREKKKKAKWLTAGRVDLSLLTASEHCFLSLHSRRFRGFHCCYCSQCGLLGCDIVQSCRRIPKFRRNVLAPSSVLKCNLLLPEQSFSASCPAGPIIMFFCLTALTASRDCTALLKRDVRSYREAVLKSRSDAREERRWWSPNRANSIDEQFTPSSSSWDINWAMSLENAVSYSLFLLALTCPWMSPYRESWLIWIITCL